MLSWARAASAPGAPSSAGTTRSTHGGERRQLVLVEVARAVAADRHGHRREAGYGEERDRPGGAGQQAATGRLR